MNSLQRVVTVVVAALLVCQTAFAEAPSGGNLLGHRGLLRMSSAVNHTSGWVGFGTDFQFFSASGYLYDNEDHSRMINSFSIVWAPIRFLEAAVAMHVTSDSSQNTANQTEKLMVAVGDPEISLKGGIEAFKGFSVGGLFDLRFPSGAGFFEASGSATSFLVALLASYSPGKIPLGIHLNFGFQYDGTGSLFDKPGDLDPEQLYAAQVSSFHRLVTRLGVDYNTKYVGPFLELSLEPFMGSGAPGFGDSPGVLSFGTRVWPTKSKSVQLLAALDIGLTGVPDPKNPVNLDTDGDGVADKYAFGIPRWNFVLRLSYRFDAYAKPETTVVKDEEETPPEPEKPKTGSIVGAVVDSKTNKPVWNARVTVVGEEASSLAVDAKDGTFKTFQVQAGQRTLVASADGYEEARVQVQVAPDGKASTTIQLSPKVSIIPGTLRGKVKALQGKSPEKSRILIPALDRTIEVGASGEFTVKLKPGEYKVVVSAKGFRTQTKTIRVQEGSTVILNVELHR